MSRYIFFEKPHKSLVFSFGEGRDVSQLRRSTQTHQNAIRSAREKKIGLTLDFPFKLLESKTIPPLLLIFNTDLWDNKTVEKKNGHMQLCTLLKRDFLKT